MSTAPHDRDRPRASVCMATYRGVAYLPEQLASILAQLRADDELVIVDDASPDTTPELLATIDDPRVRVLHNERNLGHVGTFSRAVAEAHGDVIVLADQDDVWLPGRLDLLATAATRHGVVASNFRELAAGSERTPTWRLPSRSVTRWQGVAGILLGRLPYFGSAMAFRADLVPAYLPVPRTMEAHDLWLGLLGSMAGGVHHVTDDTLLRRLHGDNQTPASRRGLGAVLRSRCGMLVAVPIAWLRLRRSARGGRRA